MPVDGIKGCGKVGTIYFAAADDHSTNRGRAHAAAARQPNVHRSERTQEFLRIRQLVDALPDVRLERVNRLAKAIDEGTYQVSGRQIAEAIIEKHLIDLKE